jgi:hypothetical protein
MQQVVLFGLQLCRGSLLYSINCTLVVLHADVVCCSMIVRGVGRALARYSRLDLDGADSPHVAQVLGLGCSTDTSTSHTQFRDFAAAAMVLTVAVEAKLTHCYV